MAERSEIVVAIVGSRDANDYEYYETKVKKKLAQLVEAGFIIKLIISGEAPGIDAMTVDFCAWNGYDYRGFPADWDRLGGGAGFMRNSDVVAAADVIIAIWDRKSTGTKDTVNKALGAKKMVQIYNLPEFNGGSRYYPKTRKLLKATAVA